LAGQVEEDGFDEAACGDFVCLAEVFCGEDCEEIVEEDVFVFLVFGDCVGTETNVVVEWGE